MIRIATLRCLRSCCGVTIPIRVTASAAIRSFTFFCACCQQSACSSGSRVSSHGFALATSASGWLTTLRIASSCHTQTPNATEKATTQMTIRVRSSVRCSTIERRSSCPMGFSRVAMAALPAARGALGLALADDLAVEGRRLALRAAERGRYVRAVVAGPLLVRPARHRVLEILDAAAELAAELREALAAHDHEHDEQNDGELERAEPGDEGDGHGVRVQVRE